MSKPAANSGCPDERRKGRSKASSSDALEQLLALRRRIVEAGLPLLDWDGVEREVRERRG